MSRELLNPNHPLVVWLVDHERTVADLAEELGVTVATIYNWIGRRRRPDFDNALRLMEITGLTYEQLVIQGDDETPLPIEEDTHDTD